jgi:predicted alpha/beta hydrolase family esterase
MQQIIHIHGGDCFPDNDSFCEALKTYDYDPFEEKKYRRERVKSQLPSNYQMIIPQMPNGRMAYYKARKIWFEKIFPYLNDEEPILIGHSLGGMFLMKYLTENMFPKNIKQLHLVAAVLDDEKEYVGDFSIDISKIPLLQNKVNDIYIYHSTDDHLVPYSQGQRISALLPNAKFLTFEDRQHFNQPDFPELLANIVG